MTSEGQGGKAGWTFRNVAPPLAELAGARPPAPDWFTQAIATPCAERFVDVDGCQIETLSWGEPGAQGLLLMHGAMAHARWWTPVAQLLARHYRVTSMSFSGMGNSGRREHYSVRKMAQEAWEVVEACGLTSGGARPAIAAHSFGGKAAAINTYDHGADFLGTLFVDSQILPESHALSRIAYRRREYPSEAAAIARFRLAPDQPPGPLFVLDAVARGAIRRDGDIWTWCVDPEFFQNMEYDSGWTEVLEARCPLAFIRGEHSPIVDEMVLERQKRCLPADTQFIDIATAHHHAMLDQPIAVASTISAIIEGWCSR